MSDEPEDCLPPSRQRPPKRVIVDRLMGLQRASDFLRWFRTGLDAMLPAAYGADDARERSNVRLGYVMPEGWQAGLELAAPGFLAEFEGRLKREAPAALHECGVDAFALRGFEHQVTLYHHRGRYGPHCDRTATTYRERRLAFAWYVTAPPQLFSGGELTFTRGGPRVVPGLDRLVMFSPDEPHEILPVECWSADPLNGRITINGWLLGDPK